MPPSSPSSKTLRPRSLRCAIYTRKSTEDGLEQEFNSLDAQREACAAYILSQRHEGWSLLPDLYDDGGFSGGNMDRPGLVALLSAVTAGTVDVIVVYKVDRLTRSLADFARIVDVLDKASASFVSVTQAFNTTSSMGRLTLNVLLSFAQFEREVTGERIRDKIAASRRKGMWMGGGVPAGYIVADRKLLPDAADAAQVRRIFGRYPELGSVVALHAELATQGVVTRTRISRNGRTHGGVPFTRGALYNLLQNRVYVGEAVHRGEAWPGEHEGLVPRELFDRVQALLGANRVARREGGNICEPAILTGLVEDHLGRRMSPSHARKGALRYRYYCSGGEGISPDRPAVRIPGRDLEELVCGQVRQLLAGPELGLRVLGTDPAAARLRSVRTQADRLIADLDGDNVAVRREAMGMLVRRVVVYAEKIMLTVDPAVFVEDGDPGTDDRFLELSVAARLVRAGKGARLAVPPASGAPSRQDPALVRFIVQAHAARSAMLADPAQSLDDLAAGQRVSRDHVKVLVRLGFLAPDIVVAILEGRQPVELSRQKLARIGELPVRWPEQRTLLGFDG